MTNSSRPVPNRGSFWRNFEQVKCHLREIVRIQQVSNPDGDGAVVPIRKVNEQIAERFNWGARAARFFCIQTTTWARFLKPRRCASKR